LDGGDSTDQGKAPNLDELVKLADAVFASIDHWLKVPDRFHMLARADGIDVESDSVRPLRIAFRFFLTREARSGREQVALKWGTQFGEQDAAYRPRQVDSLTADSWEHLARHAELPATRARFLDLLVLRGGPKTPEWAALAIAAYLEHVCTPASSIKVQDGEVEMCWRDNDLALSAGRALSLMHISASAAKGSEVNTKASGIALDLAERLIRSTVPRVGPAVSLLAVLTANLSHLDPSSVARLSSLVDHAMSRYADLDHVIDELAGLAVVIDPTSRNAVVRRRVEVRLAIAEDREPLAAMVFLEEAARIAESHGLADLAEEAVRRMQRVARRGQGFETISTSGSIPTEFLEAEIRRLSDGRDWRDAMTSWLGSPAPSGDAASNRENSRLLSAQSLVRHLAQTVLVGADYMPRWRAVTEEDKDEAELSRTEIVYMSFAGNVLSMALDAMKERGLRSS
jgi:hypothetical protein